MPFDQSPSIDFRPYVRTETQRANLHRLADVVAVVPPEKFDMSMWNPDCGSACCIFGHALASRILTDRRMVTDHPGLGITARQAFRLFSTAAPWQTAPAAAAELRRLADERIGQ